MRNTFTNQSPTLTYSLSLVLHCPVISHVIQIKTPFFSTLFREVTSYICVRFFCYSLHLILGSLAFLVELFKICIYLIFTPLCCKVLQDLTNEQCQTVSQEQFLSSKILCVFYLVLVTHRYSPPPHPTLSPGTMNLFSTSIVFPFPEYHMMQSCSMQSYKTDFFHLRICI